MLANLLKSYDRERLSVIAILACGIVARLVWTSQAQQIKYITTESHNVAVSLAQTGRFADPFANGGGATAHVGMLTPLPSALAYRLFGVDTPLAEFALSLWASALVGLSLWLLWQMACALDVPRTARIAAITFIALVPLQFGLETREGRSWEVNLALVLLFWILLRLVRMDRQEVASARELTVTGAMTGFLFIVSPPAGLGAIVSIGLFQLLRLPLRRWWIAPVGFALVGGLLGGFWMARNIVLLGEPIALRDNLGLELDLSNYSGAVHPTDPRTAYLARMRDIHPLNVGPANEKLRAAGGEVAYYHELGQEAEAWIIKHPLDFFYLSARRFVQFYLPPKWFWGMFGVPGKFVWLRQGLVWATTILGFCALIRLTWLKRSYSYILCAILACSPIYILIQPTLRYRYLVSSLLIVLAFDGVIRFLAYGRWLLQRGRAAAQDFAR